VTLIQPYIIGSGRAAQALEKSLRVLEITDSDFQFEKTIKIERGQALKGLVDRSKFSLLLIANPHGLHSEKILEADAAGFQLIVTEKPVCTTLEEIEKLSSRFVRIYNQAKTAEEGGLDEISGPGFRKSLEILIKDYVIFIKPELKEQVISNSLGYAVFNYIENEKIKNMAGLAKDVGNDETHYDKKLEELTVEDLKKLIKLTSHWMVTELLTEQYSEFYKKLMEPKKD
jgi:hypothetical protein